VIQAGLVGPVLVEVWILISAQGKLAMQIAYDVEGSAVGCRDRQLRPVHQNSGSDRDASPLSRAQSTGILSRTCCTKVRSISVVSSAASWPNITRTLPSASTSTLRPTPSGSVPLGGTQAWSAASSQA